MHISSCSQCKITANHAKKGQHAKFNRLFRRQIAAVSYFFCKPLRFFLPLKLPTHLISALFLLASALLLKFLGTLVWRFARPLRYNKKKKESDGNLEKDNDCLQICARVWVCLYEPRGVTVF